MTKGAIIIPVTILRFDTRVPPQKNCPVGVTIAAILKIEDGQFNLELLNHN